MSGWWLLVAFVGGVLAWHRFGNWVFNRMHLHERMATETMKSLSHDVLVKLRERVNAEYARRYDT